MNYKIYSNNLLYLFYSIAYSLKKVKYKLEFGLQSIKVVCLL